MRKKFQYKFYSSIFFSKRFGALILFCVRINVCLFIILCSEVSFQEKTLKFFAHTRIFMQRASVDTHFGALCSNFLHFTEKYQNIYILRNFVNIDHTIYFFVALCKENIPPLKKENLRLG